MVLIVYGRVGFVEEGSTLGSPHTWAAGGQRVEGRPREQPRAAGSPLHRHAAMPPRRHAATPLHRYTATLLHRHATRLDDVWRVATSRALGVVGVDGAPLDRRQ